MVFLHICVYVVVLVTYFNARHSSKNVKPIPDKYIEKMTRKYIFINKYSKISIQMGFWENGFSHSVRM